MNSFAHVLPFLDQGNHFAVGCVLPDWLAAADRRCRVRKRRAVEFIRHPDPLLADLASGLVQHIDDDRRFHTGQRFTELNAIFAVELREVLVGDPGFRPGFLGHILIELLLDAFLNQQYPEKLPQFFQMVAECDPDVIQQAVNQMATRTTDRLPPYWSVFLREKYLLDYNRDDRLMMRINHVLRRVRLSPVGGEIFPWLPFARERVYSSAAALLGDRYLKG